MSFALILGLVPTTRRALQILLVSKLRSIYFLHAPYRFVCSGQQRLRTRRCNIVVFTHIYFLLRPSTNAYRQCIHIIISARPTEANPLSRQYAWIAMPFGLVTLNWKCGAFTQFQIRFGLQDADLRLSLIPGATGRYLRVVKTKNGAATSGK